MPTFAFWNTANRNLVAPIVDLVEQYGVEIAIIAEQAFESAELVVAYSERTGKPLTPIGTAASRVRFYSTFAETDFRLVADESHAAIHEYLPTTGPSLLIAGVHLASKLHADNWDQNSEATRLARRIEEEEARFKHERTLVVGDLNMNPFEPGMVGGDALHAVMDRRVAAKRSRIIQEVERRFFYNPMWRLMGDGTSATPGTLYRGSGGQVHFFWNTFDQVLLRPALLKWFREDSLRIVQRIGNKPLVRKGAPGLQRDFSDHLPIVFRIDLPEHL